MRNNIQICMCMYVYICVCMCFVQLINFSWKLKHSFIACGFMQLFFFSFSPLSYFFWIHLHISYFFFFIRINLYIHLYKYFICSTFYVRPTFSKSIEKSSCCAIFLFFLYLQYHVSAYILLYLIFAIMHQHSLNISLQA